MPQRYFAVDLRVSLNEGQGTSFNKAYTYERSDQQHDATLPLSGKRLRDILIDRGVILLRRNSGEYLSRWS